MCLLGHFISECLTGAPFWPLEGVPLRVVLLCCFSFLTGLLSSVRAIFINICLSNGCCRGGGCCFHWGARDWDLLLNHPANITLCVSFRISFLLLQTSCLVGTCVLIHFSHVQLYPTLWTVAHQASSSMGFSRQEYWSELPCPLPGGLPNPGIKPASSCIGRQILYH